MENDPRLWLPSFPRKRGPRGKWQDSWIPACAGVTERAKSRVTSETTDPPWLSGHPPRDISQPHPFVFFMLFMVHAFWFSRRRRASEN